MKNSFASGLKKVFFVAITLLSMVTSFLFFTEIFSFRGAVAAGDSMAIAGTLFWGAVGVLVLDGAALVWLKTYLAASDNNSERALATVGMVVGFVGSALSSLAYLILVAAGDNVTVDPSWGEYVTYAMAVFIVVHFALVFLSSYKSTQAQIDEKTASMLAEATEEMLKLTETTFRESIPALAAVNADKLTQQLAGQFTNLSVFQTHKKAALPAANGRQAVNQLHAAGPGGAAELRALPTPAPADQADQAELARLRVRLAQLEDQVAAGGVRFNAQDQPGSAGTSAGGDAAPFPGPRKVA